MALPSSSADVCAFARELPVISHPEGTPVAVVGQAGRRARRLDRRLQHQAMSMISALGRVVRVRHVLVLYLLVALAYVC
jgi:hypothetical protein